MIGDRFSRRGSSGESPAHLLFFRRAHDGIGIPPLYSWDILSRTGTTGSVVKIRLPASSSTATPVNIASPGGAVQRTSPTKSGFFGISRSMPRSRRSARSLQTIRRSREGRRGFGLELDPKYIDAALKRFRDFTGEEPVQAETGRMLAELE